MQKVEARRRNSGISGEQASMTHALDTQATLQRRLGWHRLTLDAGFPALQIHVVVAEESGKRGRA